MNNELMHCDVPHFCTEPVKNRVKNQYEAERKHIRDVTKQANSLHEPSLICRIMSEVGYQPLLIKNFLNTLTVYLRFDKKT